MKNLIIAAMLLVCGCGYSSVDNDAIGQPKKIHHQTPMLCSNRNDIDISLGVMRGGVGSMSTQDLYLTVPNQKDLETLDKAIVDGKLVKFHYNQYRLAFCQQDDTLTSVEIVDGVPKSEDEKKQQEIDNLEKHLKSLKETK